MPQNQDPAPRRRPEPAVLARGKAFHRDVQAAYVAQLLGVRPEDAIERPIPGEGGTGGRADILLLVTTEPERMRFVIEIKSTEWEARPEDNRAQLFRRHLRQVHRYLDVLLEDIGVDTDSVVAALLYPHRPSAAVVEQLEAIALPVGVMVVFYDDMNWQAGDHPPGPHSE